MTETMEDDALNFFNDVFSLIPEQYKLVPRDFLEVTPQQQKQNGKQNKKDNQ